MLVLFFRSVSFKSGNRHLITERSLLTEEERNLPIVPNCGCLEKIRRLLKGDEYIGRGSSQRGLGRSPLCTHKVSVYGRKLAIQRFAEEMRTDSKLREHDAQACEGRSGIGGWAPVKNSEEKLDPWLSPCFRYELTRSDWQWIYERGDKPSLTISALETLAVLISLKLFIGDEPKKGRTKVQVVPTWTDNRPSSRPAQS